jgi:two-component system, chemotaxis family, sensor histidine kinase and response regulator PixL
LTADQPFKKVIMAQDKELEIRLQFLDEAQEYLETLESRLLGLAQAVDAEKINEALRAAHSIKGGAGLMGFQSLSDLAHRLEDGLKVLKIQRGSVTVDASLEQLLLQCVDCMGRVIRCDRTQAKETGSLTPAPPDWLAQEAHPLFQQLHERLGDPQEEDAHSMLSPEDGQDIIPLLFETEVEGCLQRLESVLARRDPRLKEEVAILAQELEGLGEMLQLESFVQLCQSISQQIESISDDQIVSVAQASLQIWRRTQALVMTGNLANIPRELPPVAEIAESFDLADAVPATAEDLLADTLEADLAQWLAAEAEAEAEAEAPASPAAIAAAIPQPDSAANAAWVEPPAAPETLPENTVRVPVLQINQLSDLFGELTIERNRLELEVKRLRDLVLNLQDRLRVMDQINSDLRSAYDRVATQSTNAVLQQPLLPAAAGQAVGHNGHTQTLLQDTPDTAAIHEQFDVLELDRYRDMHLPFRETIETIVQLQEVGADIDLSLDNTEQTCRDLRKTARQLQKNLTQLRMRPLSDIFDRFPRALRQMSLQYGKPVDLKIQGGRTLVDRNILEALQEPLTHIIRNCFDHGIEDGDTRLAQGKPAKGLIEIRAYQQSSRTLITVRDDGGGIDTDKIRAKARQMGLDEGLLGAASDQELLSLIFEPGFSTAGQVTDLSGRGIGMDVVRSRLKEIRGDIQVDTQPGLGTTFTLSIPYTLSVTRVLVVESHGMRMAFPVDAIEELFLLAPEQIMSTAGKEMFEWEDQIVQLVPLSRWLVFNCPVQLESPEIAPTIAAPTVLLVEHNSRLVGIQVERSWGEQEVAIRRIEGNLPMPPGFNSCTILGDGQVVPLVNVPELLYWVASLEVTGDSPEGQPPAAGYLPASQGPSTPLQGAGLKRPQRPTVMVIDDSINVRRLLALTLEKVGYQVIQAKDGQDALDKLNSGLAVSAVLCDVEMPRLDGYGFLAQLKAQPDYEALPVAMLTSRGSEKHRQLAANLGAAAYFTKPYNEQFLLKTLAVLIEQFTVS